MGRNFQGTQDTTLNFFLVLSHPGFASFLSWTSLGEAKENFHCGGNLASLIWEEHNCLHRYEHEYFVAKKRKLAHSLAYRTRHQSQVLIKNV